MTIEELNDKLSNPQPGDTFTPSEVQQLIEWHVTHELNSAYTQARIANEMVEAQRSTQIVSDAMDTLIALWQQVQQPQLEVIVDEQSQGEQA